MNAKTQKSDPQTSVRITVPTKERIQNVARQKAAREKRRVPEVEVADKILKEGLRALEHELGI